MMIRNKKGQAGQIISSFPVLIFIVILMIILFFISSAIAVFKSGPTFEKGEDYSDYVSSEDLLLEEVEIDGEKISIFEAIVKYHNGKLERVKIEEALKPLVKGMYQCLVIAQSREKEVIYYLSSNVDEKNNIQGENIVLRTLGTELVDIRRESDPSIKYLLGQDVLNIVHYFDDEERKVYVHYYLGGNCRNDE